MAPAEATTVEAICSKVFECYSSNWGFETEEDCQNRWLTGCVDTDAYLLCAADCVSGDCADFAPEDGTSGCEPSCWSANCND